MYEEVSVCWNWEDIQFARPEWDRRKCEVALMAIGDSLHEIVVGYGNDAIQDLLTIGEEFSIIENEKELEKESE